MNSSDAIKNIKLEIIDLTYFAFYIEKSADDGGETIDIYVIDDDVDKIRNAFHEKYKKMRLIFFAMEEEDILYLIKKNM